MEIKTYDLSRDEEIALKCFWLLVFRYFKKLEEEECDKCFILVGGSLNHGKNSEKKSKKGQEIGNTGDKYIWTKTLKELLASDGFIKLYDLFWEMVKMDHPDKVFLRFLKARKWDIDKSFIMLITTIRWRQEMGIEEILQTGEEGALRTGNEAFMKQLRLGKSFIQGVDREQRPVCYIRTHLHKAGDQTDLTIQQYTIWLMESARLMITYPVETATVLFDLTKFSLKNMDYAPIKFLIKCFEAHYPESLGICLIHKAPWVFQGIWKIIKTWLDPVVAKKIHFTNSYKDLEEYIEDSEIIKELGGKMDWEYKYVEPQENENIKMQDTMEKERLILKRVELIRLFEELTIKWVKENDKCVSDQFLRERDALAKELCRNYWELDPYIRARTLYDRIGMISQSKSLIK